MTKQKNTKQERKLKLAEAGILFVLILGLSIFLGAKVVSHNTGDGTLEVAAADQGTEIAETDPLVAGTIDTATVAFVEAPIIGTQPEGVETSQATAQDVVEAPKVVTYAMAEQAYFAGQYSESADLFNVYTTEHPANAWGYYMLGMANMKDKDHDAAEEAFIAALELKPSHIKSLVNYSRALLALDRPEDALVQVELALATDASYGDANRVMGRIQHNLGDLDRAVNYYSSAIQAKNDDAWAMNNLGLILIEQEKFAEALAPLAKATQLRRDIACFQNNLGVALERTGYITAAGSAFEAALAADENYAKAEISLTRLQGQQETPGIESIDLIALAATFNADPVEVAELETAAEFELDSSNSDMEVAAAVQQILNMDPETDSQ